MVDESDSDQDAPETEVIDPLAPPEDWNSPKGSRNGWWRSIGAIVLCVCLTIGISIWSFGQYWPISDDKPYFSDRNENVRMEVLIPHGWTTQYTYPYSLTPQLTIDFVGETQLSPGNTPQSDPTGLTISHFYASNELSDMSFTDSDVQRDGQSEKELRTAGRRLAQINNPKVSVDSIDGRKATAFDYALSSPSGVHQCTERQVEVNGDEIILRLCSPANAKEIPQDYQNLLSSIRWAPRRFPQSDISTDTPVEGVDIPVPQGWKKLVPPKGEADMIIHPSEVAHSDGGPKGTALTIRRFPSSLTNGTYSLHPTNSPIVTCDPQWRMMANSWSNTGAQTWLEDRTIGGRKACGYSQQDDAGPTVHYWFVEGRDGLWIFTVTHPSEKAGDDHEARDSAGQRRSLAPEESTVATQLLDQVKWTDNGEAP